MKLPITAAMSASQVISREFYGKPMGDIQTKEYKEEGKLGLGKTILYFLLSCVPTLAAMLIHPFAGLFTNLLTFWFALRNDRIYFASVTIVGTLLSIFTNHLPDIGIFLKLFYLNDVNNTIEDKGKHIADIKPEPESTSDGYSYKEPFEGPDGDEDEMRSTPKEEAKTSEEKKEGATSVGSKSVASSAKNAAKDAATSAVTAQLDKKKEELEKAAKDKLGSVMGKLPVKLPIKLPFGKGGSLTKRRRFSRKKKA
jgi:hypothetical protein